MTDKIDQIHQLTNDRLAKRLEEYAHRHVGEERETYLEAARRLRIKPRETFNHEAFSID